MFSAATAASAVTIDDLKMQILDRTERISELEKDIEKQQKELEKVGKQASTLKTAITELNLTERKLETDIRVTETKISATALSINKLNLEISDTEEKIETVRVLLVESVRRLNEADHASTVERLLTYPSLSEVWSNLETLRQLQIKIREHLKNIESLQEDLVRKKQANESTKDKLASFKDQLGDQKVVVQINKNEKDTLLAETKNKESEYKKLLAQKLEQKKLFESELQDFESQLQIIIDPNSLPPPGIPIFSWPISPVRITQFFGNSYFAQQNPGIYGGRAYHPGVDFGVPLGTPIHAPIAGTVIATGNTDSVPGCYSWGKWVLLRHSNGLSTLYAHLSVISSKVGDRIDAGGILGYSGSTGYSTGPHLHFTVYATDGVQIVPFEELRATSKCKGLVTPAAAPNAYVDPMNYLPAYKQ